MGQYLPIVCLLVLATLFGALSFFASRLLAPRRPSSAKEAPYECGIVPSREPPERFPVTFYVVAMLFVMFDIELIFIYPYAVDRQFLGTYGFIEMLAFSAIFFGAFVYVDREAFRITYYTGQGGGNGVDAILDRADELEWHCKGRNVAGYGHPYTFFKIKAA